MVVKIEYSKEEISTVLAESREARKHLQKLGRVMKTVAAHRLKELKQLQAVGKLATWRRTCGFDRLAEGDDSWVHGPLPLTPEYLTVSLWSDLKELKNAISMPVRDGSRQREKSFIEGIEQGTVSFSDDKFAMIKRFVKRRGCDRRLVQYSIVSPVCLVPNHRSMLVSIWRKRTRVGWTRSRINSNHHRPVRVLKYPDSSVPRTGKQDEPLPTVVCFLAWARTWGETLFPPLKSLSGTRVDSESTTPPAAPNTIFLKVSRKPEDKTRRLRKRLYW